MLSHFPRNDIKKAFLILCKERSSIKKHIKKIHFFKSISRLLLLENYPSVFLALQFSVDRPCKYVFEIKFQFFLSSCHSLNYFCFCRYWENVETVRGHNVDKSCRLRFPRLIWATPSVNVLKIGRSKKSTKRTALFAWSDFWLVSIGNKC